MLIRSVNMIIKNYMMQALIILLKGISKLLYNNVITNLNSDINSEFWLKLFNNYTLDESIRLDFYNHVVKLTENMTLEDNAQLTTHEIASMSTEVNQKAEAVFKVKDPLTLWKKLNELAVKVNDYPVNFQKKQPFLDFIIRSMFIVYVFFIVLLYRKFLKIKF
ncbi:hypothetical protein [Bacillus coreaensis]